MDMSKPGEFTAKIGDILSRDDVLKSRGFDVLFDHGDSSNTNVGNIVSWYGSEYVREAELSLIDIAIIDRNANNKAIALVEIEETNDRPKTFLGDVFGVLMGDHICFGGKLPILVDEDTTLIVLGKSEASHENRNNHICEKVLKIKSGLSTGNSIIVNVFIESFSKETGVDTLERSILDKAFKGEL
jgi:hypothetical protein